MSTTDADTTPDATTAPSGLYTVNRSQDGAQVRSELSLDDAQSECVMLNAQARAQVGLTAAVYDGQGVLVKGAQPIFASMFQGAISLYEVRSDNGLVIG